MTSYKPLIGNGFLIKLSDIESYRTTLYDVLLDASKGKLELLFEVPVGKKLILLHGSPICDYRCPPVGIPHPFETKPDYLVLLPGACAQLIREPFVQSKYSVMGYARKWAVNWPDCPTENCDGNDRVHVSGVICELIPKSAMDADKNTSFPFEELRPFAKFGPVQLPWGYWGLDSGNPDDPAAWFKVEIEDLYIITRDFFIRKRWAKAKNPSVDYFFHALQGKEQIKDIPKKKLDFLSDHLLRACEASQKLWGCETVSPGRPESYPKDDEVVRWLMDQDLNFTKTVADDAASLIKPAFAENSSPSILQDQKQGENNKNLRRYSDHLVLACEASLALWGSKRVIPDDRDTHPSNLDVLDWLRKKIPSFKKDTAGQIARLIRPSFSEGRGRRSK